MIGHFGVLRIMFLRGERSTRTMRALSRLVVFWIICPLSFVVAVDNASTRESLAGLRGVKVVVETLEPEVEHAGLTSAVIQTDAELKLRLAGIRVLTTDESRDEPGHPYLYLNAIVNPTLPSSWGYSTSVDLIQDVRLTRNPAVNVAAHTWSVSSGGGEARPANISDSVRNSFKDKVDQFVNAYLAMNPK